VKTIDMLLAYFGGSPIIPFEDAAEYLRYKPDTLKHKTDNGKIRVPYFSIEDDSQKAQKYLSLIGIAALIDMQHAAALEKFDSSWAEQT